MYGLSSIPFVRSAYFRSLYDDGIPQWTTRFETDYHLPVPRNTDREALRKIAIKMGQDLNLEGPFGAYRPNRSRLIVYKVAFWGNMRLIYDLENHRIRAEDKRFRWDQFFTSLHARGGFHHDEILNDAWAVVVDLVCIGFVVWIASGIYMWWLLRQTRLWGTFALGGGVLSFFIFLLGL